MQDPQPSNISGQKVHRFEHRINWGYVALAVAAVIVLSQLAPVMLDRDDREGTEAVAG